MTETIVVAILTNFYCIIDNPMAQTMGWALNVLSSRVEIGWWWCLSTKLRYYYCSTFVYNGSAHKHAHARTCASSADSVSNGIQIARWTTKQRLERDVDSFDLLFFTSRENFRYVICIVVIDTLCRTLLTSGGRNCKHKKAFHVRQLQKKKLC